MLLVLSIIGVSPFSLTDSVLRKELHHETGYLFRSERMNKEQKGNGGMSRTVKGSWLLKESI